MTNIQYFGLPLPLGAPPNGVKLAPEALRAMGLLDTLKSLGHNVHDMGDLISPARRQADAFATDPSDTDRRNQGALFSWVQAIQNLGSELDFGADTTPLFVGGDHATAAGTLPLLAARAQALGRPLFVLWLDAHPDFHTPQTSTSGNMHGTPIAYATGEDGFDGVFPPLGIQLAAQNVFMLGLRSVDPEEKRRLAKRRFELCDMRRVDEEGIVRPLQTFLERVEQHNGLLHLSFDVDALDPSLAPGCGTPVNGGLSLREAHLVMEILFESSRVNSLEIVELNPLFDCQSQTAKVVIELTASLFGKQILEK